MKEFQDVVNGIRFGSILLIDIDNNHKYNGYIREYDGDIFLDIKTVKVDRIIELNPNIRELLDDCYICQIEYNYDNKEYISSIYKGEFNISKKSIDIEEGTIFYQTTSHIILDSIIELDTILANSKRNQHPKIKERLYA